jgi:hypothetical protein
MRSARACAAAGSSLGQVLVDWARRDVPRPDQGQRREHVRVIERGDLGDHSAPADGRQVRVDTSQSRRSYRTT